MLPVINLQQPLDKQVECEENSLTTLYYDNFVFLYPTEEDIKKDNRRDFDTGGLPPKPKW